jgi:hypothetical protein
VKAKIPWGGGSCGEERGGREDLGGGGEEGRKIEKEDFGQDVLEMRNMI